MLHIAHYSRLPGCFLSPIQPAEHPAMKIRRTRPSGAADEVRWNDAEALACELWARCIGIDDDLRGRKAVAVTGDLVRAERFAELFHAVYLTFHRRDRPRSELPGASRAVLEHLALAGPLTIGEASAHMRRAQSMISEIVTHLERDGLLERENDPRDRRRTLIWLTPAGHEALRRDREVLGVDLLACAMARLPPDQADALNAAMRALIECAHSDVV
jgi:DNA-binding MarR family transcriptional regulator